MESNSTATLELLLLLQLAKKAFYITPITLSLSCHSWPEHEVRLSNFFTNPTSGGSL